MSCYVMNPDSIRRIAYTLSKILSVSMNNPECSIATDAAEAADLHKAFRRYYSPIRGYNVEGIAEDLYTLNCRAYDTRYKIPAPDLYMFPLPSSPKRRQQRDYHRRRKFLTGGIDT